MYCGGLSFRSGADFLRGIAVLRDMIGYARERTPNEPIRLEFHAPYTPDTFIYVYMKSADLYVTSIQSADGTVFVLNDSGHPKIIAAQRLLGFSGHYSDLSEYVSLGEVTAGSIDAAITSIARWTPGAVITSREKTATKLVQGAAARQVLTILLVTAESARFNEIPKIIANALDGYKAGPDKLVKIDALVNQWGYLSTVNNGRVVVKKQV